MESGIRWFLSFLYSSARQRLDSTAQRPESLLEVLVLASVILGHLVEISYKLDDFNLSFAEKESLLSHIDTHSEDVGLIQADGEASPCYDFGDLQESEIWFASLFCSSRRETEAAVTTSRVVEWRERVLGPEHELTLDALSVYLNLRQVVSGEEDLGRVRRIVRVSGKVLGRDHEKTFRAYTSLVFGLVKMRHFEEAVEIVEKRLKPLEILLGPQHPMTTRSLFSQAVLLGKQGNLSGAEALCRRSLEIGKPVLGLDHFLILNMVYMLELCLVYQGKANETDPMLLYDVFTRLRNLYGANHKDTLFTMKQYAKTLFDRKEYSESEAIWREMIDQIEHSEGENEDDLIDARGWLGTTLHKLERYDEAVDVWCRAAHSYKQSAELQYPDTDPNTDSDTDPDTNVEVPKYAVFFQTLIEYQQAEAAYRNALHTAGSQYDPDHPKELVALKDLASLLGSHSKHVEAEEITRRVVNACGRVLGSTHPITISSYSRLGKVLAAQRKFSEAEDWFRQCYSIKIKVYGEHQFSTLRSLWSLGRVLESQSKYEEAEKVRRRVVETNEQNLGPTDPKTLTSYYNLAHVLECQEKNEEAEQWFRQCWSGDVELHGERHEKTLNSADRLASSLESQSKYEEAGDIRRRIFNARNRAEWRISQSVSYKLRIYFSLLACSNWSTYWLS
jgi:tetratricopeptide (TPR) repeat protein